MPVIAEKTPAYELRIWVVNSKDPWTPLRMVSKEAAENAQQSISYNKGYFLKVGDTQFNTAQIVCSRVVRMCKREFYNPDRPRLSRMVDIFLEDDDA